MSVFLTDVARDTVSSKVTAWLTPSLMLLMTSLIGTKRKRELVKKCGHVTQLLSCKASADIPRVPASAVLSLVATWFHCSSLVYSKISQTRFETKVGCFSLELIHWRTVVLSSHMNTRLTVIVNACVISPFSRAASRAACNSSFGRVITSIGATRTFPKTNASSFVFFARRSFYSGLQECDRSENILRTITKHMQLYVIKGSTKVTSRDFDVFKLW